MSVIARGSPGYTRMILIGAAVLLSLGMGIRQSLGLFLTPVTRDLGLAAADFTLAIAVQNIVWGLSQAPIGALTTIQQRGRLRLSGRFSEELLRRLHRCWPGEDADLGHCVQA